MDFRAFLFGEKLMTLWILKPTDPLWMDEFFDITYAVVVRAESEINARILAEKTKGACDLVGGFLDPLKSSCTSIPSQGEEEVICTDYRTA
jgi:hypothetical protein